VQTLRSEFNEIKNKDTFLAKALLMMEVINKVNERSGSGYALHKAWLDAIEKNTELEEEKYISDLDIYKVYILLL
jgi:5-deoxy-D-glucuronate isomerase